MKRRVGLCIDKVTYENDQYYIKKGASIMPAPSKILAIMNSYWILREKLTSTSVPPTVASEVSVF